MVLLINGNELNVSNVYEERDTNTNTLYLIVDVPYETMEYGALKAIFKNNTEDIVRVDDLGETRTYESFVYNSMTDIEEDEIYKVKLIGDENIYQTTRNRELEQMINAKNADITKLNNTLNKKNREIDTMTKAIAEKDSTIEEQSNAITEKDTIISDQAVDLVNLNEEMLVMAEEYADVMFEFATLKLAHEETVVKDVEVTETKSEVI